MKELTEAIRDICNRLIVSSEPEKQEKWIRAYQKYNEYLLRLENRYRELLKIEKSKELLDPDELHKQTRTLEELQLEFVDKTEAFHQQVYATISAFILLLSHVAGHKYKGQLPISGVTKFLKYIALNNQDEKFNRYIKFLKDSINFRAKYIDHPQQHVLHDWMTYSYGTGTCIIYFVRKGDDVYAPGSLDPFSSDFKPPVGHESFYVSPPHEVVYICLQKFTKMVLESIQ